MKTGTPPDKEPYVPIGDRINQDVMHDNFVPRYSGLASARPRLVVILGVWMIFGTWAVFSIFLMFGSFRGAESQFSFWFQFPFTLANILISVAILFTQTRRYFNARNDEEPPDDEMEQEMADPS